MAILETAIDGGLHVTYEGPSCTRCILPAAFPLISFDNEGTCSYCVAEPDVRQATRDEIRAAVESCLAGGDQERIYDCIVLYSGGKDSTRALMAAHDLGLRILAFTLDNSFMSAAVSTNMQRVVDALSVEHMVMRPPAPRMRRLYRVSLEHSFQADTLMYSTGSCGSCIGVVLSASMRLAKSLRVPLLIGGWTPGQLTTNAVLEEEFLRNIVTKQLEQLDTVELGHHLATFTDDASRPVRLVNPLYAAGYSERSTLDTISTLGWTAPSDTDSCSTNCRLNGLLIVDHIERHGYHPYVYELAHHVRIGALTRAEALHKVTHLEISRPSVTAVARELGLNNDRSSRTDR